MSKSHNSNWVSLEKSASTAPALVPVAINGKAVPGDQANVAVRGISRRRTMMKGEEDGDNSQARLASRCLGTPGTPKLQYRN